MIVVGVVLVIGMMLLAIVLAGLTLWSGWRAVRDELGRNFRSSPAGPSSFVLTLLGVVVPVVAIAFFLLALAYWLIGLILL